MATPSCSDANTRIKNNPCLAGQVLTEQQRCLLEIWFLANELSVNGGTNYTNVLASTLVSDANTFAQNLNPSQRYTVELSIHKDNAVAAGASLSTDFDTLMGSVAPLTKATPAQLANIRLMLLCKLGCHRTPPAG